MCDCLIKLNTEQQALEHVSVAALHFLLSSKDNRWAWMKNMKAGIQWPTWTLMDEERGTLKETIQDSC